MQPAAAAPLRFPPAGTSLLKIAIIVVIAVASFTKADASNMHPFTQPAQNCTGDHSGAEGVFTAVAITYYGGLGWLTSASRRSSICL